MLSPRHVMPTVLLAAIGLVVFDLRVEMPEIRQTASSSALISFDKPEDLTRKFGFTAAICVCVKDAEAYFEEWIDYHFAMEFANIYIYDDSGPTYDLQHWYRNTRQHPVYSRVEVIQADPEMEQKNIYEECVKNFGVAGPKHDFLAFIDIDEFFVLQTDKYSGIMGVLKDYLVPYGGGLVVNWVFVGTSNKSVYSPLPVTKRFQYRRRETHVLFKSIVKSSDYLKNINAHRVEWLTIDGEESKTHTTAYPGATLSDPPIPSSDVILLYHFRFTSLKEYIFKRCITGRKTGVRHLFCSDDKKGIQAGVGPAHAQPSPGDLFDDKPWQFLMSHVPKYRLYNEFEDFHGNKMMSTS